MHVYTPVHICVHEYMCVCVCACHSVYVEVRTTSGVSSCHLACLRQGLLFFTIAYTVFQGFSHLLMGMLALQMCATVDSHGCCILRSLPYPLRQLISFVFCFHYKDSTSLLSGHWTHTWTELHQRMKMMYGPFR